MDSFSQSFFLKKKTTILISWSPDINFLWTGAPRDCKDDARGSVFLVVKQPRKLQINQTLRGEQTGSYFGNAVETTDLNNDG